MSWKRSVKKVPQFDFTWTHIWHMNLSLGASQRGFLWRLFHQSVGFSRKSPQSSMDLHGIEWYWRARANHDATRRRTKMHEKIKKRKRFKTRTRCTLVFQVFVAIERLTLSNLNWIDRDRGFHIQDCCFITFDLFRPDDENGGKWGPETAFIFGQIR